MLCLGRAPGTYEDIYPYNDRLWIRRTLWDLLSPAERGSAEVPRYGESDADGAGCFARWAKYSRRDQFEQQERMSDRTLAARTQRDLHLRMFGRTIDTFALSSEQSERLLALLAEHDDLIDDVRAVSIQWGIATDIEYRALVKEAQKDVYADVRREFGDDVVRQVEQMFQVRSYLLRVNETIAPALEQAGTPLSSQQVLPLAVALKAAVEPATRDALERNKVVAANPALEPQLALMLTSAKAVLSDAQFRTLEAKLYRSGNL